MVAHLYRVAQDAAGNVLIGAQVSVCQPGSDSLISELLFADAGISVPQTNPYTSLDGVIDFYLEFPRTVKLKLDYGGQVRASDYLDVLPPAENILANLDPVRVINQAFAGAVLTMTDQSTAEWSNLGGGSGGNVVTGDGAGADPVSITKTLPGSGNSLADSDKSIAIGDQANVDTTSLAGIAIGSAAYAFSPDDSGPLAIGWDASADGSYVVAIGNSARAAADGGTAIGPSAFAGGVEAVAIGRSQASGAGSIAIGSKDGDRASASTAGDIAIGGDAIAVGGSGTPPLPGATSAVAIGADSYANSHSVAIGEGANADVAGVTVGSHEAWSGDPGQTAVGHDLIISAPYSTVVGYQGQSGDYGTSTAGAGSIALGAFTKARKDDSVALGHLADAKADSGIALGLATQAVTANSVAIGPNAVAGDDTDATTIANTTDTIAFGMDAGSYAARGVAIGKQAIVAQGAVDGIAIGDQAQASGVDSIAIGAVNPIAGWQSTIAIGTNAFAVRDFCIALGQNAYSGGLSGTTNSIAIGKTANATGDQAIAIGLAAQAADNYSVNIGVCSDVTKGAHGRSSVAIGVDAKTTSGAFQGVALGRGSSAEASGAISIGASLAMGGDAVAVGTSAQANGNNAIGLLGLANFNDAVAIGIGSAATAASDFVLGAAAHKVKIAGRLNVAQRTPANSADAQGAVGDITSDGGFVYVKTATGWKRAALSTF